MPNALKKSEAGKASLAPCVAMVSLGCSKNLVDSEELLGSLYQKNFRLTANPEHADVVIINTCGFIQSAIDESLGTIGRMLKLKKSHGVQSIYAMGCYASRGKEEIVKKHPGLDGVYALNETQKMVEQIQAEFSHHPAVGRPLLAAMRPVSTTLPHYSFLKIAEGCDRTCTYCTIPSIRGANVSKSIEVLVKEAHDLVARGVVELNIIAQDTTAYGIDLYGEPRLLQLLQGLEKVEGLKWIRLLYAYPDYISDSLADFLLGSPKMVKYLELPIQHASPSVLKRMNRGGTFQVYDRLFDKLRAGKSDYALRTTVIVGFPGESDEEYLFMLDYCRERQFDRLGVFEYFKENGTPAFIMKQQVPAEVTRARKEQLMGLQRDIHFAKNDALVGTDIEFIVDSVKPNGELLGRTWRDAVDIDANIHVQSSIPLKTGAIATCRVSGKQEYDLLGVL